MVDIVRHLLTPPFGTETTERLLMERAAAEITRLREELAASRARKPVVYSPDAQAMSDRVKAAEAERDALREENARLREALKPFAEAAYSNMGGNLHHLHTICSVVTLDDLRRARAAIRETSE